MTLRNRTVPLPGRTGGLPLGTVRDKRIVTLLFTDVEGSTRLLGSVGDTFVALIERQRAILTGAAGGRGGVSRRPACSPPPCARGPRGEAH